MNDDHDDPTSAEMATFSDDELASRLLDGDISTDEVPDSRRAAVVRRMETFARLRRELSRIELVPSAGDVDQVIDRALAIHRRQRVLRRPRSFGIAAAAASILVVAGLGFTRIASNDPADVVADGGAALMSAPKAADSEPAAATVDEAAGDEAAGDAVVPSLAMTPDGAVIEFDSAEELRTIADSWSVDALVQETARESSVSRCPTEKTTRVVTANARYQGQVVEIHLADDGRITVLVQADCSIALQLGN